MGDYSRKLNELMRQGQLSGTIELSGEVTAGVRKLAKDSSGKCLIASGTDVPADGTAGYAKGAIFLKTNVGAGTSGFYENVGTTSACNFDLIGTGVVALAWNDILDAAVGATLDFVTYAQIIDSQITNGDTLTIRNTGNFGDISILKVEQKTGNPTDGTVLEVVTADAQCDALSVVAASAEVINVSGSGAITIAPSGAAIDGITFSTPNDYTGQLIKVSDTLVGTTGEGIVDIKTTANMAEGATLVRLDVDTGTLVGATDGFILSVDDDSGAAATSYAVKIDSANNEALHVATGKALFDEPATFTLGIDSNGSLDVDLATNADNVNVTAAAADYAAGASVVTVYGSAAAGQTNDSYLLRLVRKADGDAQDSFISCEDNSTGAAANGDQKFKVAANGAVTAGAITTSGLATLNGGGSIGAPSELTIANGAITITHSYHTVDTAADAASDDLDTIDGGTDGQILVLRANNSARTVVIKNNTGNIQVGTDVTLDNAYDTATLLYDGGLSMWLLIASSNNGA
jgi:hypothetical protein